MRDTRKFVIEEHEAESTLSAIVRGELDIPWSKAKQLVTTGRVSVGGTPIFDVAHRVQEGDEVEVHPTGRRRTLPELESERILHVDHDVVVVDKPAGLVSVPYDDRDTDTLLHRTQARLALMEKGKKRAPLGVVQRLDKDTTGVMVFARTRAARKHLENQLRAHDISRRYLALAYGQVRPGTFETHLVADRGDGKRGSWRGSSRPPKNARRAVTHVAVRERLEGATLVVCELETGRQHQIRIHLSEAGHPLVGERVYGRRSSIEAQRPMLHARDLGFRHPSDQRLVVYESPIPEDFAVLLDALRPASKGA